MLLQDFVITGKPLDFLIVFLAGFFTFFAGCLLPLVPTYLAYLSGVSLLSKSDEAKLSDQKRISVFKHGLMFVLGFVSVFVILGAATVKFSAFIYPYRIWLQRAGGIIFVWMGLSMLGLFKSSTLNRELKFDITNLPPRFQKIKSFLMGVFFAAGWTPCIGPVLAMVIYWVSYAQTVVLGSTLLLMYGVGLGVPFLLIAGLFDKLLPWLDREKQWVRRLSFISGVIVLIAGIFLLLGQLQMFSYYITHITDFLV